MGEKSLPGLHLGVKGACGAEKEAPGKGKSVQTERAKVSLGAMG